MTSEPPRSVEGGATYAAAGVDIEAGDRTVERAGWPFVDVVDRRKEDPRRADLYSPRLVDLIRSGRRVVCVLNRKGRISLLACAACGELARCERCGAAVALADTRGAPPVAGFALGFATMLAAALATLGLARRLPGAPRAAV